MLTNERINFKKFKNFKKLLFSIAFGIAIFSFNPISAYAAGWGDGESAGDSDITIDDSSKPVYSNNADSQKGHLEEYCTFWSSKAFPGCESLGEFDNNANPDGSAPLINGKDPSKGRSDKNTSRTFSEDVLEFEGYFVYDIKISLMGTDADVDTSYLRRTYYKYYELRKESRLPVLSQKDFYDLSTGIWLYFSSNKNSGNSLSSISLIDVFTGLALDNDIKPYKETLFLWVMSSEGVAVAGDNYTVAGNVNKKFSEIKSELTAKFGNTQVGNLFNNIDATTESEFRKTIDAYKPTRTVNKDERLKQIKEHCCYDLGEISKPENFELVYFSKGASSSVDVGEYEYRNPNCPIVFMVPNTEEVRLKVTQLTGHLEYAKASVYIDKYWTGWPTNRNLSSLGIRSVMGGMNTLVKTNQRKTYPDLDGNEWDTWFVHHTFSKQEFIDRFTKGGHIGVDGKVHGDYSLNNMKELLDAGSLDFLMNKDKTEITLQMGLQYVYAPTLEEIGIQNAAYYNTNDSKYEDNSTTGEGAGFQNTISRMFRNGSEDDLDSQLEGIVNKVFWDAIGLIRVENPYSNVKLYCDIPASGYPKMTVKKDGDGKQVPRECLRTLQVFLKTNNDDCFEKMVGFVNIATEELGPIICDDTSSDDGTFDNLTISKMNELIKEGNYQKVLEIYAIMFAASCEFCSWLDYASDGLKTSLRTIKSDGHYGTYTSSCITENIAEQSASRVFMGDTKMDVNVVDLYKAFNVSKDEIFDIAKIYRDLYYPDVEEFLGEARSAGVTFNISDEKIGMIIHALNGWQFEGVLTDEEINRGSVFSNIENIQNIQNINESNDLENSESATLLELETSFVPYVVVIRKYSNSEYNDTEQLETFEFEQYDGSNTTAILGNHLEYLKEKDENEYLAVVQRTGAVLFDQMFSVKDEEKELYVVYQFGRKIPEMRECLRQIQNEIMTEEGAAMLECISRTIPSS